MTTDTEYEKDGLYLGTVDNSKDRMLLSYVDPDDTERPWIDIHCGNWVRADRVTDVVGPLRVVEPGEVVLDLDDLRETVGMGPERHEVANWVRRAAVDRTPRSDFLRALAAQIEAQTKPKRMPEPGWGTVVTAEVVVGEPKRWVRVSIMSGRPLWLCEDRQAFPKSLAWEDLVDYVVDGQS